LVKGAAMKRIGKQQAGFTLVEIAIVLVIIGLLLGGILKGQEMITQAKIKNIVNDLNGMSAAIYSYQDRYRAMPGDELSSTVAARWAGAFGGDGNGQFTGNYNNLLTVAPTAIQETNTFWWHLRLAGFVAGPTAAGAAAGQQPSNASNGIMGVATGAGAATLGFSSNILCTTNLPDKIAIALDTQMDDGTYNTGQVRGILQAAPNPALRAQVATDAYAETGTNQYVLCKNL